MKEKEPNNEQSPTPSVTDLEVGSDDAEDVQGGAIAPYGSFHGGVFVAAGDLN